MNESNPKVCKVIYITLLYLFSDYETGFYFFPHYVYFLITYS